MCPNPNPQDKMDIFQNPPVALVRPSPRILSPTHHHLLSSNSIMGKLSVQSYPTTNSGSRRNPPPVPAAGRRLPGSAPQPAARRPPRVPLPLQPQRNPRGTLTPLLLPFYWGTRHGQYSTATPPVSISRAAACVLAPASNSRVSYLVSSLLCAGEQKAVGEGAPGGGGRRRRRRSPSGSR